MPKKIQAKHVDEAAILAWLNRRPGEWHTHWMPDPETRDPDDPWYLRNCFPDRGADIPDKVLNAKLGSMVRRGLIEGCDCGCRGDWHVLSPTEIALRRVLEPLRPFTITTMNTTYNSPNIVVEAIDVKFERLILEKDET